MLICAVLFFSSYWILIDKLGNHGLWAVITVLMIARVLILTLMAPDKIFQRLLTLSLLFFNHLNRRRLCSSFRISIKSR